MAPPPIVVSLTSETIKNRSQDRLRGFSLQGHPFMLGQFCEDWTCGHSIKVVTVHKEDVSKDGENWARKVRVTLVAETTTLLLTELL